ncbi:MAG: O-antigen ligase family protein [Terracidiphilus sp.]
MGVLGATAAALFISFHWTIALAGGSIVFLLSALENEKFILFVIFLMPFGWILSTDTPVRNVQVVFHFLVAVGFFTGQSFRSHLRVRELFRPVISRASLLYLCIAVVPTILDKTKQMHESLRSDFSIVTYVAFYFVIVTWANSRDRVCGILRVLMLSTIVTALFALYQEASGGFSSLALFLYPPNVYFDDGWIGRATSLMGAPNNLAGYLNLILPFSLACCVLGPNKWKKLSIWTFGLGTLALLATQSLGGLAGFAAFIVLGVFRFVPTMRKRLAFLGGLCTTIGIFYFFIHIITPVHTDQQLESDAVSRLALWASAWDLFTQHPAIGVGWGNFTAIYGLVDLDFIPDKVAAHNIYLQLLSETGLAGFLAFFYLVGQSWRQAERQWRRSKDFLNQALAFGVQGALLTVLVHGFVDFLFQVCVQFGTLFWTLLALLVVSSRGYAVAVEAPALTGDEFGMGQPQAL